MKRLLAFAALIGLLLTGCWDAREIDRRAFVFVIGIDREPQGSYRVTGKVAYGIKKDEPKKGAEGPTLTATGATVGECLERMATLSDRRLDWGNLRSIVLGEPLSRRGAGPAIQTPLTMPRVPSDVTVLQARGRADRLVTRGLSGEASLQTALDNFFSKGPDGGVPPVLVPAWQFKARLDNPGIEPHLGGVSPDRNGLVINDLAIFTGDRLAGWLGPERTRAFRWTLGRNGGYTMVRDPAIPGRLSTINVRSMRTKLGVSPGSPDRLLMALDISVETVDAALTSAQDRPAYLAHLAAATRRQVFREVSRTVSYIQRVGSDVWGYGELMRRRNERDWNPGTWPARFRAATWDIRVNVRLTYKSRYQ